LHNTALYNETLLLDIGEARGCIDKKGNNLELFVPHEISRTDALPIPRECNAETRAEVDDATHGISIAHRFSLDEN